MIKRLLALDGVIAVCRFRDDGGMVESYGVGLDQDQLGKLSLVAHEYRRMLQGHADLFSMFTNMRGWTPPRGWAVRAAPRPPAWVQQRCSRVCCSSRRSQPWW